MQGTDLIRRLATISASLILAACVAPPVIRPVAPPVTPTSPALPAAPRYQPVSFDHLPGWQTDDIRAGFKAWKSGCGRLKSHAVWGGVCAEAQFIPDTSEAIRTFLQNRMIPLRLNNADGSNSGLITGYYEPVYLGSLQRSASARYPLYGQPEDLITVELSELFPELKGKRVRGKLVGKKLLPYPDRAEIERKGVTAPVLAWLNDPLDVQFMQVQGSGRVRLPDGQELRLGYSDQNGRPYQPVGRWLVQQGELPATEVSMQSIRAWAMTNPSRVSTLLDSNPSYVFFRALPPSSNGPIGSLGIPLTPERSLAVDPGTVPLGSMVFIATTRPDSGQRIERLAAAQDTGGAIKGSVRADFFWGTGPEAGELAGHMKQVGNLWLLWPKDKPVPN